MRIFWILFSILHALQIGSRLSDKTLSKIQTYQEKTGISDEDIEDILMKMTKTRHKTKPMVLIDFRFLLYRETNNSD